MLISKPSVTPRAFSWVFEQEKAPEILLDAGAGAEFLHQGYVVDPEC